jgi:ribosomal protein S18 acetylase RimI-like enzyme
MTQSEFRFATIADIAGIQTVVSATDLFPAEMVEELITPILENGLEEGIWLVGAFGGEVLAFSYAVPEKLTHGTWNMLALAVHPSCQNAGLGRAIVSRLEDVLVDSGQRMIVVDTSSDEYFAVARLFYQRLGYQKVARIPDYWDDGEDKLVYFKRLPSGSNDV